jgi:hypothetical protein
MDLPIVANRARLHVSLLSEHLEEGTVADILGVGHLPQYKDCAIDAKDSPENDIGRYPVDSLGDFLPEPEAWRPRRVERAASPRSLASMSRVPAARRTEHLEKSEVGLACHAAVRCVLVAN